MVGKATIWIWKKFMGRGGWATMKHGDSMGGPIGDNKTTGTSRREWFTWAPNMKTGNSLRAPH